MLSLQSRSAGEMFLWGGAVDVVGRELVKKAKAKPFSGGGWLYVRTSCGPVLLHFQFACLSQW